jgi:methylthioribose-1-phosphate isomerase
MLQAIKYNKGDLEILDQLRLPFVQKYIPIQTAEDGWHAIKDMQVRGAPAIAIVAMLALASELTSAINNDQLSELPAEVCDFIRDRLAYLVTSRPTAVNLSDAAGKLENVVSNCAKVTGSHGRDVAAAFIQAAEDMLGKDLEDNQRIGHNGAEWIVANAVKSSNSGLAVLTHCNTGYDHSNTFEASDSAANS